MSETQLTPEAYSSWVVDEACQAALDGLVAELVDWVENPGTLAYDVDKVITIINAQHQSRERVMQRRITHLLEKTEDYLVAAALLNFPRE